MLELHLGFMSIQELAQWSNRSEKYLSKNKKDWCEKNLTKHAIYNLVRGGVEITKIIDPIFCASGKKEVEELFDSCYGTPDLKADTNVNAWCKIKQNMTLNLLKDSTGYNYTCQTRRERYGIPFKNRKRDGLYGYCQYIFCKILPNGEAALFTEEELKIKKELSQKYLSSREEQIIQLRAVKASYEAKEITKEEYDEIVAEAISDDLGWEYFQSALEKAIDCKTDFRTLLIDDAIKLDQVKKGSFKF